MKNISDRDYNDMHKEVGSLMITDESIYVDSTDLTIEEVVNKIVDIIKERKGNK
jgi:cytidylate kinase